MWPKWGPDRRAWGQRNLHGKPNAKEGKKGGRALLLDRVTSVMVIHQNLQV